jgi:SAM-dependent methyltransferase
VATTNAQSLREQRFARAIDREVAPLWHDRFARLVYRRLPRGTDAFTLDVHCGPGRTTFELLERLGEGARVLALEPDAALRNLAKARMRPEWKGRVYLKDGALTEVAGMGAGTYDLVVANLVLGEVHGFEESLRELLRVTKPGGHVLVTLPMAGTWVEVEDLFREVLRDASLKDAIRRMRHLSRLRPSGPELARAVASLGVGPDHFVLEQERSALLFASGREFLFSPVIEHGPLRLWKAILGAHDKPQELFWRLKEAIDAYHADSVLVVSVVLGLLHIRVPEVGPGAAHSAAETAGEYWRRFPELDAVFGRAERGEPEEDIDIELDDVDGGDGVDEPAQAAVAAGQAQAPAGADAAEDELEALGSSGSHTAPSASSSSLSMSAEDQAIFALLDQPVGKPDENSELDALLDQVLEFAKPKDHFEEIEDQELEEMIPEDEIRRPGETLKRIRSLLPPPPAIPPPLPGRRGRGR